MNPPPIYDLFTLYYHRSLRQRRRHHWLLPSPFRTSLGHYYLFSLHTQLPLDALQQIYRVDRPRIILPAECIGSFLTILGFHNYLWVDERLKIAMHVWSVQYSPVNKDGLIKRNLQSPSSIKTMRRRFPSTSHHLSLILSIVAIKWKQETSAMCAVIRCIINWLGSTHGTTRMHSLFQLPSIELFQCPPATWIKPSTAVASTTVSALVRTGVAPSSATRRRRSARTRWR